MMNRTIRAGCLIVRASKILLVRGFAEKGLNYWIPPSGGLHADETISDCAVREAKEETGFDVVLEALAYVRHCHDLTHKEHGVEFFFLAKVIGGCLAPEGDPDKDIAEARWFSQADLQKVTAYPEELKNLFWTDLKKGFPRVRDLGLSVF